MENRKYPIGKFEYGKSYNFQEIRKNIERISKLPKLLKKTLKKAKSVDLDKKYRPGGWTARQVIHHLADSHINAYIRFKLAATEINPTIRPYDEKKWAMLNDGADAGVKMSIALISSLHKRLSYFLESLTEADFQRTYFHPGSGRTFTLGEAVALYAWHGKHHLKHIELALGGDKIEEEATEAGIKVTKIIAVKPVKRKAGRPTKPKPVVADAAPKRKAGRPAKVKLTPVEGEEKPKRKAGRPAKPKPIVADAAPKRKAGRPAKVKLTPVEGEEKPKRKAGRPAKPKPIVTDAAPKQKAGRPAKVKLTPVAVRVESITNDSPKRRGRPPVNK